MRLIPRLDRERQGIGFNQKTFEPKPNYCNYLHYETAAYHFPDRTLSFFLHRLLRKDGRRIPGKSIFHQEKSDSSDEV
ncbi:hypothetical protein [Pseudomonas sp. 18173]|uniref:hypothetical protein n=1 Tax=Pseudomonas sp. 18173 TaxID=3390055 RepID=UPI003D24F7D3